MFWKINETKYPLLSKIAKKYLRCPFSSVAFEREFKVASHISGDEKIALLPENIEMLLLLKNNLTATEIC